MITTVLLIVVVAVVPSASKTAYLINAKRSCWSGCGYRGGICPGVCGPDGYCCRRGRGACDKEMQAVAPPHYHTCVKYVAPYDCTFVAGDGRGVDEIRIGDQQREDCIESCVKLKKTDGTINGVTVKSDTSEKGCWCEKSMRGVYTDETEYKTCFLIPKAPYDCTFVIGGGRAVRETKYDNLQGNDCIQACVNLRKVYSTINGVTVYSDASKKGCWCNRAMGRVDTDDTQHKTCLLAPKATYDCTFGVGDGSGVTDESIGNYQESDCIQACVNLKQLDDRINGVTVDSDNGCWCEKTMSGVDTSDTEYKTCFLVPKALPPTTIDISSEYLGQYKFDKRQMSWSNAERECEKWGGHLATIISQAQNDYIASELKKRNMRSGWIGLNDLTKDGSFKWVGAAAHSGFTNWGSDEPNGGSNENCVEIISGRKYGSKDWKEKWNDTTCRNKNQFICERPGQ